MDNEVVSAASVATKATGELLDKGLLGIFCLFLIVVVVHLFRALRTEGREHAETLKALNKDHADKLEALRESHSEEMREAVKEFKDQMQVFFDRHTTKAETWVAQGADMTAKFNAAFDKFVQATEAIARRANKQQHQAP